MVLFRSNVSSNQLSFQCIHLRRRINLIDIYQQLSFRRQPTTTSPPSSSTSATTPYALLLRLLQLLLVKVHLLITSQLIVLLLRNLISWTQQPSDNNNNEWTQQLLVIHNDKWLDIDITSAAIGASSTTPLDAPDQPTVYPQGSVYMFDKKFKGLDKSEEIILMLSLLDVHPGCAVTIRDSETHPSSIRLGH